jgi:redox-sensitive bicupin YhaK (pirin superfamily)
MISQTPAFLVQKAANRYSADHGWLKTAHSFSFAEYFDPQNVNWGALRVFNDDRLEGGSGFPTHPHRDMEILTYVFAGRLEHEDSMGNRGIVGPGGVQFMSAGTGVRHGERNADKTEPLHLVQMWVLPGETGTEPTYGQVDFTLADRLNRWLVAASGEAQAETPIVLTQRAALRVARIEDAELKHDFRAGRFGFLFVGAGSVHANGEALASGDAVRMAGEQTLRVSGTGEVVLWDVPPAPA